jgi:Protein of unknown function (DUF2608)
MKKIILSSLIITASCNAQIVESNTIQDVFKYIEKTDIPEKTLILFDLDNTLIRAKHIIGTAECHTYMVNKIKQKTGLNTYNATLIWNPFHVAIDQSIDFELLEPESLQTIKTLQKQNYRIMGLTGRQLPLMQKTLEHIDNLGLDLRDTALYKKSYYFIGEKTHAACKKGIIFADEGNEKGATLIQFLNNHAYKPDKVIFFDDILKHVKSVVQHLTDNGIPSIGIWFKRTEKEVNAFDSKKAEQDIAALCETNPLIKSLYQESLGSIFD